ncbi:MAG: polysaccharide deacetylase family protein [Methylobacteriaceae bacterium]|nr:polysaccharide deacetylase family protein [Methylobacteriaceae bacterium]
MGLANKHRLIAGAFAILDGVRADRWLGPIARGCGVALMFHHVRPERPDAFRPNALLEVTPGYLDLVLQILRQSGIGVIALDEVPSRLAAGGPPFAVLTFDDGLRDNLEHALPILERHGAPWTLFITTDYANGTGRLWWIELEEILRRADALELRGEDGRLRRWPARDAAEKNEAFGGIYADLRAGPESRLRDTLAAWGDEVGLDRDALVRSLCMGWDELRALAARPGVTIGAHTLTHPMLAKHPAEVARREMAESRAILEARLGTSVRHLAYPVGDPGSAGPREFALARDLGFVTAVTTRPGHLFREHRAHLTALPRVSINGLHQSEAALRALLSGVPFLLWNRGRRLRVA